MLDYVSSPKNAMQVIPALGTSDIQRVQLADHPSPASPLVWESSKSDDSPSSQRNRGRSEGKSKYDSRFRNSFGRDIHVESKETPLHTRTVGEANIMLPPSNNVLEDSLPEHRMLEELVEEHNDLDEEAIVNEGTTTLYDQEVAEAKLKLILRIWRRLSLKKRKLRQQKQLAANAALTSLLLGPPIWSREVLSGSSGDFDIDWVMSERCEIRDKSLSSLNVSELVAAKLSAKNPDAKCLCWKVVLLTEDSIYGEKLRKRNEISHFAAGSWLQSKLFPAGCNDDNTVDLPVSSPGMSIWKKWLPSQSGDEVICCFTIIKDVKLGNLKDEVTGASAILFLASEYIPWESQRNWLHNFLMALPFASSLPLLVLSGLCEDDLSSSSIMEELKLRDIDKSHISNFSVAFLRNQQMNQFNGFYSDVQLREGLQWLASESPSQPLLHQIKTRDLVHYHLNSLLEVLDDMDDHELGPNHCISAFNEALDQASRKVVSAVQANGTSWPCPEICLLEESCDEYKAVSWFLPRIGWSSAARIEPLIRALSDIKLPPFDDDIRLICRGSDMGKNIERQRSQLESCLIRYFTESSQMMSLLLAAKEAGIALQKFAQLELRNSVYCIKPKWVLIFQRVFHWRLMELSDAAFSAAYILWQDYVPMSISGARHRVERSAPLPYLAHPSLDEMVAVSCDPPTPEKFHVDYGALQPCSEVYHSDDRAKMETVATEGSTGDDGRCVEQSSMVVAKHDNAKNEASNVNQLSLAPNTATAADRLSELLDKCNIVQSMIQEKLSIYF